MVAILKKKITYANIINLIWLTVVNCEDLTGPKPINWSMT